MPDKMMYNIAQDLLVRGSSCWVRVGNDASDAQQHVVGFVDSMNATKQIQLQRAQVCGSLVPASIDPQAITVNLNMTGFLASANVYKSNETYNGGGNYALASFNPNCDDYIQNQVATKFPYLDFYDDRTGQILAAFKDAIPSSFRVTVQGGSYVKADISMEAIWMSSGDDYTQQGSASSASAGTRV